MTLRKPDKRKFGLDVGTPVKGNVGAEGETPVPNKR